MNVPYAAWPKYGPSVLGQAEYDRQISAWQAYQDSNQHRRPEGEEMESGEAENMDSFTYTNKYVKADQSRKRIFREQNIRATSPEDAMKQGRDAMLAELGAMFNDENERQYRPVPGSEKIAKPRGKAFEEGEDERRNDEGTNGHDGQGQGDGQGDGDGEGENDGEAENEDQQDDQQDGDGEGAEGDGDGESQSDDDTPKMPTCPECQQPRGSTEGCCAPPESGDLPKPEQPSEAVPNLQLLRTDGEAPYSGDEANNKIQTVAHVDTVDTIRKSLDDVDTWTRGVVDYHIHQLSTELYGQMTASHLSLKALIAKGGGESGVSREALLGLQRKMKSMLAAHEAKINVAAIAEQVGEILTAPQRIEIVYDDKVKEIKGTPHKAFKESLKAMKRGLNLFLVGPAGSGKGFLAQHLAEAFELRFGFVSCSEGMSEGMVLGRGVPLAEEFLYLQSSFVDFYENGGVFLLDEIDAANPNVLLIINECLSSPHLAIPNRVKNPYAVRHKDFHVIVAANTWGTGPNMEYVGRNRLDAAFLNRFIGSTIELGYDARIEGEIAKAYLGKEAAMPVLKRFWNVRKKLDEMNIRRIWSTRGLEKMCIALADGDDMATVLDAHTRGWTVDEKNKAGVAA